MSQESKSISQAKRLVMKRLGFTEERANTFVRGELRHDIPALRSKKASKFILGTTRMFCDNQIANSNTVLELNTTLKLIVDGGHYNEYDRNLNGLSAQDLIDRFSTTRQYLSYKEKEEINNMTFKGDSDYDIIRIDSFEQAQQYHDHTTWCITQRQGAFKSYTDSGHNQFYFCLRKDWDRPRMYPIVNNNEEDTNTPLDDYGLSMIAVSVNEDGELNTCTCRWNHDHGGNDSIMNAVQISKLVNRNFFETFKPNPKWTDKVNKIKQRLAARELYNYDDIDFEIHTSQYMKDYSFIEVDKKFNLIDEKNMTLKFDKWFVTDPYLQREKPLPIEFGNRQWNYLTNDGNLLLKENVPVVYGFLNRDITFIQLQTGIFIAINTQGKKIFNKEFQTAYYFSQDNNQALVEQNGRYNWIDMNGNFMSDKWYDWVSRNHRIANYQGKFFVLDDSHEPTSKSFDSIVWNCQDYHIIEKDHKYNVLDNKGNIISNDWFDKIYTICHLTSFALQNKNGFYNLITDEGPLQLQKVENITEEEIAANYRLERHYR